MYGGGELVVGRHDPTKERTAPRLPTPVSFPDYQFLIDSKASREWTAVDPPDYFGLRLKWQYATGLETDLDAEMWKTINVEFQPPCVFEELLGEEGRGYYPPEEWLEEPNVLQRKEHFPALKAIQENDAVPKLFNGRTWPTRGDFYDRYKELMYDNEDGFRAFARVNLDDGKPFPRLTLGRPFFEQLDTMVQYWDTSRDEYIPPSPNRTDTVEAIQSQLDGQDEPRKKTKLSDEDESSVITSSDRDIPEATPSPAPSPRPRRMFGKKTANSPPPPGKYRGWRIDAGKNMPSTTRDMIVKALVDLAVWPFCMHVDQAERSVPKLSVKSLRIVVPLSKRVWRDPATREEARRGAVVGPAIGISARHTTGFGENKFGSDLDVLRELGALLLVAQERNREGKSENVLGKGKWWNEKPRWAGLPYEVPGEYQKEQSTEEVQATNGRRRESRYAGGLRKRNNTLPQDMTVRQRAIHLYKINAPSIPTWDAKVKYARIGTPDKADHDEAFLISCLNHHISIVKLSISKRYVEYLDTGKLPENVEDDFFNRPVLQRTKWYNLMSPSDRAEAFRALWALSGYVSRNG